MDLLKEPKEEPLFDNYSETSQNFAEERDIKEEETPDDEVESHFAMSSFFSPARSEFPRSMAPEPMHRVKEKNIDPKTVTEKECKKETCRGRRGRPSNDERLAIAHSLPVSAARICDMALSDLKQLLKTEWLTETQRQLIKKIRRRGGNRAAARKSRERRRASHCTSQSFVEEGDIKEKEKSDDEMCESSNTTVKLTVIKIDDKKESQLVKRNDSELKCPECEFRTRSVMGWMDHLRKTHSTTPNLAGLTLRCDCGHEGPSDYHSRTCDSTNTTVIRTSDMKKKATPQCILCEVYPKTLRGYAEHLQKHHKTTLKENGIYLTCSCIFKVASRFSLLKHKECNERNFTLHKLLEE